MNVPPWRRANRMLNSAVRAVPMCSGPVGLGAIRQRMVMAPRVCQRAGPGQAPSRPDGSGAPEHPAQARHEAPAARWSAPAPPRVPAASRDPGGHPCRRDGSPRPQPGGPPRPSRPGCLGSGTGRRAAGPHLPVGSSAGPRSTRPCRWTSRTGRRRAGAPRVGAVEAAHWSEVPRHDQGRHPPSRPWAGSPPTTARPPRTTCRTGSPARGVASRRFARPWATEPWVVPRDVRAVGARDIGAGRAAAAASGPSARRGPDRMARGPGPARGARPTLAGAAGP